MLGLSQHLMSMRRGFLGMFLRDWTDQCQWAIEKTQSDHFYRLMHTEIFSSLIIPYRTDSILPEHADHTQMTKRGSGIHRCGNLETIHLVMLLHLRPTRYLKFLEYRIVAWSMFSTRASLELAATSKLEELSPRYQLSSCAECPKNEGVCPLKDP